MASPSDIEQDYHYSLDEITKIPKNSVAILPCDKTETKRVVELLKRSGVKVLQDDNSKSPRKLFDGYYFTDRGELYDAGDFNTGPVEIYRGDFSNEAITEYAFISHGGLIAVYKEIENNLIPIQYDKVIINNLIPQGDMSKFYLFVAYPFAIIKNGKTYLRFMDMPIGSTNYDKTKLQLCTYLWQGNKFTLTGPNLNFTGPAHSLAVTKDCIGAH